MPSLAELRNQIKEQQQSEKKKIDVSPEIEILPGPKKEIKPLKKAKKTTKSKTDTQQDIKITSDEFRTAFFLLTKTSSRKDLFMTKGDLESFFNDYKLIKSGKDFYFQKKE